MGWAPSQVKVRYYGQLNTNALDIPEKYYGNEKFVIDTAPPDRN